MSIYINPVTGNREIWREKPQNYLTEEEWKASHPAVSEPVSEDELWRLLRSNRDEKLAATDYLLMPDYPLDDVSRGSVRAYRQALRDLPAQPGAPWDGGGDNTPWPVKNF